MTRTQTLDLKKIFEICRSNRKHGIELLYSNYYNKLFGIAFSIVKDQEMSEDVVHNVIYKLMTIDITKFPTSSESIWLYKVIKNEALSQKNKGNKIVRLESMDNISLRDKNINEYIDLEEFYSIIKPLDDRRKEIVSLKILGGYTHKEIAKMVDKPIGTVQWLYNTSIKKLKYILGSLLSIIIIVACGFGGCLYKFGQLHTGDSIQAIQFYSILGGISISIGVLLLILIAVFIIIYTGIGQKRLFNPKSKRY